MITLCIVVGLAFFVVFLLGLAKAGGRGSREEEERELRNLLFDHVIDTTKTTGRSSAP